MQVSPGLGAVSVAQRDLGLTDSKAGAVSSVCHVTFPQTFPEIDDIGSFLKLSGQGLTMAMN